MLWQIETNEHIDFLFFEYQKKFSKKNGNYLTEKELFTWTKKIGLKKNNPNKQDVVNFLLEKLL